MIKQENNFKNLFGDDVFEKNSFEKEKQQKEQQTEKKVENAYEEKNNEVFSLEQQYISQTPLQTAPQKTKNLISNFLKQVINYAETSGENLDQKTKSLAVDIITSMNKYLIASQIEWEEVDVQGCGLISQIKRFAKLGLSMEDKLYPDIRNNNKTGKKDIYIKMQYQTLEKLMVRFFSKPILRYKEDVICVGDVIEEEENFRTGLSEIISHKRNQSINRNDLGNIIGAYKIAYIQEGKNVIQHFVKIDKNRIGRAYNASPSREKNIWKQDSRKMVLKTATWEMWNDKNTRAFMVFPEDIVQDLSILEENEEMNWNAETKYQKVEQVQNQIQADVATSEIVNMTYKD